VGLWVCGSVGLWVCGSVGAWVHGSMGPWVHGPMGPWVCGFVGLVVRGPVAHFSKTTISSKFTTFATSGWVRALFFNNSSCIILIYYLDKVAKSWRPYKCMIQCTSVLSLQKQILMFQGSFRLVLILLSNAVQMQLKLTYIYIILVNQFSHSWNM